MASNTNQFLLCVQEMCPISRGLNLLPILLSTFLGLLLQDKRTSLFHSSSTSILWTKFQRDPGQILSDTQLFLCVD